MGWIFPSLMLQRPSAVSPSLEERSHDVTLNASSELSFQDCEEGEHSLEADAEVTINPHTMRLGESISPLLPFVEGFRFL